MCLLRKHEVYNSSSFGRDQTCAMLLAIASGNTFLDLGDASALAAVTSVSPDLATVAKQAFYDFGERPMWAERTTYGTGQYTFMLYCDIYTDAVRLRGRLNLWNCDVQRSARRLGTLLCAPRPSTMAGQDHKAWVSPNLNVYLLHSES